MKDDKLQSEVSKIDDHGQKCLKIFCQLGDCDFTLSITKLAREKGCEIFVTEPFSTDILNLDGFIYILDRNYTGRAIWEEYVTCCDKYELKEPRLIVDTILDWELLKTIYNHRGEKLNYIRQFDLQDPNSVRVILKIIKTSWKYKSHFNDINVSRLLYDLEEYLGYFE